MNNLGFLNAIKLFAKFHQDTFSLIFRICYSYAHFEDHTNFLNKFIILCSLNCAKDAAKETSDTIYRITIKK